MRKLVTSASVLLGVSTLALSACSGSSVQNSIEPAINSNNPATQSSLRFAVGTANIAGTVGLNSVTTLRQTAGNVGASILDNAPTIVGPAGFTVPAAPDAYTDAGTAHISSTLVTNVASTTIPASTFDPADAGSTSNTFDAASGAAFGIASSFGIIPAGVTNTNNTPSLLPYPQPFYAAENPTLVTLGAATTAGGPLQLTYVGGPPAFVAAGHTSTQDGTFTGSPPGYQLGFDAYQATPAAGTYTLNVVIPTGVNSSTGASGSATVSATSALTGTTLPAWTTAPTFAPDGAGGGTITTNFAGGAGVTEEYIELVNLGPGTCQGSGAAPYFYTFSVAPGTATVAVPDNIGAANPGKTQGNTLCTAASNSAAGGAAAADDYAVYGFAVNWPLAALVNAEVANANAPTPTITGAAGTDDITLSPPSSSAVAALAKLRRSAQGLRHK